MEDFEGSDSKAKLAKVLGGHIAAKRRQFGFKMTLPTKAATKIKEGTDAEPMRVGDVHILKRLLDMHSYLKNPGLRPPPALVHDDKRLPLAVTKFLAGRYVGS